MDLPVDVDTGRVDDPARRRAQLGTHTVPGDQRDRVSRHGRALPPDAGGGKSDKLRRVWTRGLARWYAAHGRHDLPWRATDEPWAILVSEVMLQQTQVARVSGRWESFLERWPAPAACAAAPLDAVLREWQGLGYPRRARALHDTAKHVAAQGWPDSEAGLRELPGIGRYTARALRVLAFGDTHVPPQDVNIARVTARAALGQEPGDVRASVHRGSARAIAAPRHERARLHLRALRRRCAALPGAAALPRLPARGGVCVAGPAQPRAAGPFASLGAVSGERPRAAGSGTANHAERSPAGDPRRAPAKAGPVVASRERSDVAAVLEALVRERLVSPMGSTGSIT